MQASLFYSTLSSVNSYHMQNGEQLLQFSSGFVDRNLSSAPTLGSWLCMGHVYLPAIEKWKAGRILLLQSPTQRSKNKTQTANYAMTDASGVVVLSPVPTGLSPPQFVWPSSDDPPVSPLYQQPSTSLPKGKKGKRMGG
ncbi:uncharacterized protein TNIN_412181 [Trichonephila inaurata madagascariensis]|uniref:Uncharacterized protein n=1 Tax=Trichonephila inaurata madagascariensis TaxID=2747483 RepID=A0A8X6M7W9_9ARAC|nr:uncharacterized protein TNIN_412181 [Trichonephila inaurata madagascariensis]